MPVILLLSLIAQSNGEAAPVERPNILFVFADDLGFGDLACYGNPLARTPHCDRLAREGARFTRFTVASGVCSPSRTAAMTGQFPSRHRIWGHFATLAQNEQRGMPHALDPDVTLITRLLQQSGYATGHYGKWHLSSYSDTVPRPEEYGLDEAYIHNGNGDSVFDNLDDPELLPTPPSDPEAKAVKYSRAATEHAAQFIRRNRDQPWLVQLWLHETHQLVVATEDEKSQYADVPEPQRTYLANVSRADRCVGKLLDLLDELDLAEQTLVVFSSDNGPENSNAKPSHKLYTSVGSAGDRRGRKRSLYLGGINVPLIVRWPGHVPEGHVDEISILSAVDLLPTFAAAAGVELPNDYRPDGENVLDVWRGKSRDRSRPLFWHWPAARPASPVDWPELAMQDGRHVLVLATELSDRVELYDVLADPSQASDLADSQPQRAAEMKQAVLDWKATLPPAPMTAIKVQDRTAMLKRSREIERELRRGGNRSRKRDAKQADRPPKRRRQPAASAAE